MNGWLALTLCLYVVVVCSVLIYLLALSWAQYSDKIPFTNSKSNPQYVQLVVTLLVSNDEVMLIIQVIFLVGSLARMFGLNILNNLSWKNWNKIQKLKTGTKEDIIQESRKKFGWWYSF